MQRKYGRQHRRVRAKWERIVNSGSAVCPRCKKPIRPYEPWDLDHDDTDPTHRRYLGASHRRCNRAEPLRRLYRQANGYKPTPAASAHDCRVEFAPELCAECRKRDPTPATDVTRWSLHWDSGRYNPRCKSCRERGSMCDLALKFAREEAEEKAR